VTKAAAPLRQGRQAAIGLPPIADAKEFLWGAAKPRRPHQRPRAEDGEAFEAEWGRGLVFFRSTLPLPGHEVTRCA
jgi:hypothetical protein